MIYSRYFGRLGKKASLLDSIYIAVAVIILMFLIVFAYKILSTTNTEVQAMGNIPTEAKTAINQVDIKYINVMDVVFILFWLASFIGALISAWFVDSHPVFFILSIIVLIVLMVAVVPLSNMIESVLSSSMLVSDVAKFPIIIWFADNFFIIFMIQTFIISFSLYSKMRYT